MRRIRCQIVELGDRLLISAVGALIGIGDGKWRLAESRDSVRHSDFAREGLERIQLLVRVRDLSLQILILLLQTRLLAAHCVVIRHFPEHSAVRSERRSYRNAANQRKRKQ